MDHFLNMDTFVRVAEVGSFAEVARQLNVSKSVITTRIHQLEEHIGVPLFHRTTRNVHLSEAGETYYPECAELVAKATEVVDRMRKYRNSPSGTLRIHGLPGLVLDHMAEFLTAFMAQNPHISFDFVVNDLVIDPVKEGFDCALQIFAPISEELVQRKLFPVRRVFCASPRYLDEHDPILHPYHLEKHPLGLYSRYPTKGRWLFEDGYEKIELELKPTIRSTSVHFLKEIALTAKAVVCLPTIIATKEILNGSLTPLLRGYHLPSYCLSAVYPKTQRNTVKLRMFLDAMLERFPEEPPWDIELIAKGHLPALPKEHWSMDLL